MKLFNSSTLCIMTSSITTPLASVLLHVQTIKPNFFPEVEPIVQLNHVVHCLHANLYLHSTTSLSHKESCWLWYHPQDQIYVDPSYMLQGLHLSTPDELCGLHKFSSYQTQINLFICVWNRWPLRAPSSSKPCARMSTQNSQELRSSSFSSISSR